MICKRRCERLLVFSIIGEERKGKTNKTEKEYLAFIIKATKNMQGLIQDLLKYSHVNNTENNILKINVIELLDEVGKELQVDIQKNNATNIFQEKPFLIKADNFKLKQVFQNLLMNALKFTQPHVDPIVRISCKEDTKHWLFAIEDNGIGIDEQYQERIFLLFKRLHGKKKYEGTDIGLAMCKKNSRTTSRRNMVRVKN